MPSSIVRVCAILAMLSIHFPASGQTAVASDAKTLADGCRVLAEIQAGTAAERYGSDGVMVKATSAGYCAGYLNGVLGGYSAGVFKSNQAKKYCLPASVNVSQIARLIAKYVEEHPEVENIDELTFVLAMLAVTWPCR